MYHYVYLIYRKDFLERIKNNKPCFYVGVRSSMQVPELDNKYMGSGLYIKFAINKEPDKFEKLILKVFNTRNDACLYEALIVNEIYVKNKLTYNLIKGGKNASNNYRTNRKIKIRNKLLQFYKNGGEPWMYQKHFTNCKLKDKTNSS